MEKKIFHKTNKILFKKNLFDNLNGVIEGYSINCKVLFLVDMFFFKKYKNEIENLKKCSLNDIHVFCAYNYSEKTYNNILNSMDESYSLMIVLGEKQIFNFAKLITIKNNINAIYLVETLENCDIFSEFCKKTVNNCLKFYKCLPPTCIVIKEKDYSKEESFNLLCHIACFNLLNLDGYFYNLFKNEESFKFKFNKEKSLINNAVAFGLMMQKNEIHYGFLDEILFYSKMKNSEFNKFVLCNVMIGIFLGFIKKIGFNNAGEIDITKTSSKLDEIGNLNAKTRYLQKLSCLYDKKTLFNIISLRNFLINKIISTKTIFDKYTNTLKTLNNSEFYYLHKSFNLNRVMHGIKMATNLSNNCTFLKIVRDYGCLN